MTASDDAPDSDAFDMAVSAYLRAHRDQILSDLSEWVECASIAGDPAHALDLIRSATWLAGRLRDAGFEAEIVETGDSVAVVAALAAPGARASAVVYSHHDVRAATPGEWRVSEPFRPRRNEERLYGRGASDAKGQVIAHLWAVRAMQAVTGEDGPAIDLRFVIEGEEEIGSPNLRSLLEARRAELSCDVVVFSDTVQWPAGNPSAVAEMRGTITASLTVQGPERDVHSGVVSGASPNPIHALTHVLAALHDAEGRVALSGFYDDVAPVGPERRRELDDLPFRDDEWIELTETRAIVGESGHPTTDRLWARPDLEVLTISAGETSGPPRAVIPASASATLSVRTVPDQSVHRVADQLRRFVAEHMADGCTYTLEIDEVIAQEAYTTPRGPELEALERALARGWGAPPRGRMGNAGGGPADVLSEVLGAPVVFLGTGLPDDRWHANDESVHIDTLLRGAASIAALWHELGGAREARA